MNFELKKQTNRDKVFEVN